MKQKKYILAASLFSLFLALPLYGQQLPRHPLPDALSPWPLPKGQQRFTRDLLDSLRAKQKPYYVIPNDSTVFWNNNRFKPNLKRHRLKSFHNRQAPSHPYFLLIPPAKTKAQRGADIDPDILYAPNEPFEPSGIIIRPSREIDPKMIYPPKEKERLNKDQR